MIHSLLVWCARLLCALVALPLSQTALAQTQRDVVDIQNVQICDGAPWSPNVRCQNVGLWQIDSQDRALWIVASIRFGERRDRPQGVNFSALAASRAYWDGLLIGENGRPSSDSALEIPGRLDAVFPIPETATDRGLHSLVLEVSTGQLPIQVLAPVQSLSVGDYREPRDGLIRRYLPAMTTAGALLLAAAYFGFTLLGGQATVARACLTAAAVFAATQLATEAARAFVPYLYPVHAVRIWGILLCATGFGLSLVAFTGSRFAPAWWRAAVSLQAAISLGVVILVPAFNVKTAAVITASMALAMVMIVLGRLKGSSGGWPMFIVLAVGGGASLALGPAFLDRDFFLWLLILFLMAFWEDGRAMARSRQLGIDLGRANDTLSQKISGLQKPERLSIGTSGKRRYAEFGEIVRLAAADDYTEVFFSDGAHVLHDEPLHLLMRRLGDSFVRVHRSHAINIDHVTAAESRQGRLLITVSTGDVIASSRRMTGNLRARLEHWNLGNA